MDPCTAPVHGPAFRGAARGRTTERMTTRTLAIASFFFALPGCGMAFTPTEGACLEEGWCWVRGRTLIVTGDRSRGTVLAIGGNGAFARWDGDHWAFLPSPTARTFVSAWSARPGDAWASDDAGGAWHWDGARWEATPASTPIRRVMGASDGSAWAIASREAGGADGGESPRLLRREGDRWGEPVPATSYCLFGDYVLTASGEIWSAGLVCDAGRVVGAEVRRFTGDAWVRVGARLENRGLLPSLSEGPEGMVLDAQGRFRWNGSAWVEAPLPLFPQDLAPGERAYFDGVRYTRVPQSLGCEGIYRADDVRAWCWGAGRIAVEGPSGWSPTVPTPFDETSGPDAWSTLPAALWSGSDTLLAWGRGPDDVYRVRPSADSALEHFDGASWSIVTSSFVLDLAGTASGEVWVATADGLLRGRGGVLEREISPTDERVEHVTVLDDETVVASTRRQVWVASGRGWQLVFSAEPTMDVLDVAGRSVAPLWILEHRQGRTNEMDLRHGDGAGGFPVVTPPIALEGIGMLETSPEGAWLATAGALASLETGETYGGLPFFFFEGSVAIDASGVWVITGSQAARHAR